MALADAVKRLRNQRGWKQQELARRSGLQQGYISSIENGVKDNPTQDTQAKLAAAFGLSVGELLEEARVDRQSAMPPEVAALQSAGVPDTDLQELAAKWEGLTADDRQLALVLIRSMWERRHADAAKR